jgi:uncharacterized damage-inducible protein DinB
LTSEQLDATISGAFGSISDTLQHIVTSEQSYFSRISTGRPRHHSEDAAPLTIAEMVESVRRTGSGLIEWAPKVRADDTLQLDWAGSPREVPKTIILTQVINHATEHAKDNHSHPGNQPRHRTPLPDHGDFDTIGNPTTRFAELVIF